MTRSSIKVREAVPEDAPQVGSLYEILTAQPCSVLPLRIAEIAADARSFLFVTEHENSITGTAFLSLCLDPMYGFQPFALVENVIVYPALRGMGIGAALMRHMEACCVRSDCSKIMLLSAAARVDAHRFFGSLGYASDRKVGFVKYRSQLDAQAFQMGACAGSLSPAQ
jgi:GNAT superfamily N-acetyltransferase